MFKNRGSIEKREHVAILSQKHSKETAKAFIFVPIIAQAEELFADDTVMC